MKTAIVTGGSKGIGKEIVKQLAQNGLQVILNYNKSEQQAKEIKEELNNKGYKVQICKADVSKRMEVQSLVEFTKKTFGKIDILINNAGIDQSKLFTDITDEDWNKMISSNLNSVFYMTQEVVKDMISEKQGCIINISSIWGMVGGSCEVHYSVSKAGIDAMTKALAKELGPSGIRINSIAPGMIMTQMNEQYSKEELKNIKQEIPLQKIGKSEDVAKCVNWLIEDNYTTGQIISPNGGWVI